jgi:hypothetical protein
MAYLYGDSSPFPLNENFIETLRGATDTCIALLQADEGMEQVRDSSEQEKRNAERDLAGVEKLSSSLSQAIASHEVDPGSPYVGEVHARLMTNLRSVCESAARDIVSRRDSGLMKMESQLGVERGRVPQALERFLLRHELPETQWSFNWLVRAGATQGASQAHAWAVARTPSGLEATFELDLSASGLWSRPFRVGEVRPDVVIQLPRTGRWNREAALKEERLDKYVVTEVSLTPGRCAMVVRKKAETSPGLEFMISQSEATGVTVKALDDPTGPDEPVLMESVDAAAIAGLWETLAVRLRPLADNRARMVQALLEGTPIAEIESPARVASLIVSAISPYVREMVKRSAVSGELVLKREVGDGRREEIFISVRELTDKFGKLSAKRQAFFEEFGLVYDIEGAGSPDQNGVISGEMVVNGEMIVAEHEQRAKATAAS